MEITATLSPPASLPSLNKMFGNFLDFVNCVNFVNFINFVNVVNFVNFVNVVNFVSVFLSVLIFGFPNSDFQNILIPRGPRVDLAWTSRGPRVDLAWTSRGPREKTKCVSNDRSRRDDQNAYRIIKIGAILGYFWPLQSLTPER